MLYEYLTENYTNGEPIFIDELPGNSRDYIRQQMKSLADQKKIERFSNGIYYLPYKTILGTEGRLSFDKYVEKKFLYTRGEKIGYTTGLQLANQYGFTTQNPSCIEICSNQATTKQRRVNFSGRNMIIYKPLVEITDENCSALQFLDLMTTIDKYSEISGDEFKKTLKETVKKMNVDFKMVKRYISLFPDKVYRNIYQGGLMSELV